ncbi:MAG: fructosamine kinase family protein [Vicingaceae bacterium]
MIPAEVEAELRPFFERLEVKEKVIEKIEAVSGGSINQTFCLHLKAQKFFLKLNDRKSFPKMFVLEKQGLELLRGKSSLLIPEVYYTGDTENFSFLLMEYFEKSPVYTGFWESFGKGLAELHQNTSNFHGLEYDNYIGSLKQPNKLTESWLEFFSELRLKHQASLAFDQGRLRKGDLKKVERLCSKLDQLIPQEKPALLHGDLWSGNFLSTQKGVAALVDPAVYYGHREVDLAMTHLFGGFTKEFYQAYHASFPLEVGWEERIELFNLYPLLVHVNLFGASYVRRLANVLKRFT